MFNRLLVGNGRKEKSGPSEHELKGRSTNPNNSSSTDTSASDVPKKRSFLSFGKNKDKKRTSVSSPVSPVSADSLTDVHPSNSGNVGEPVIQELDHEMKSLGNSGKNYNKFDLEGASPNAFSVKETALPVESEEELIRRKRLLEEEKMKRSSRQPLQYTVVVDHTTDGVQPRVEESLGERGRLERELKEEKDRVYKMEEDYHANVEEKRKLKEENETLSNKVQELTEALKNALKPVNTTDPSLPECDVDRKCHSLPPSNGTRVVINELDCIELHDDMHSSEVKQSVDAVRAKGKSSDYTPKGQHVSTTTSQPTPDTLKRQHEEAISKAFEENCILKNQLSEMTKENEKLQAEKQQLILSSRTTMREAQSEKEHTLKTLKEKTSNLEANNRKLTKDLDVAREELDAAKEEIDARIQHEVKITRDLRASIEEKSRFEKILKELQDQCGALQLQLELNKGDFEQERNDRATAAGRYDEEKEQLLKTIEDMRQNIKNKDDQMSRLSEQFRHSTFSSQGLEHKLQRQETEYRHLEQQLKREIDQLKQQQTKLNKELKRRSPKQTRGGRSGRDEDTEVRIVTLQSVNSHLTEENERQMREFQNRETHSRQLEQQLRGTIHQLKQENAYLEEQKRVERTHFEGQHQVLSQQYHDSRKTVEELREEIRKLKNEQLTPLPSQRGAHTVSRGVRPLCLKAQDIKLPPEFALTNDIVEKDGYPTPLRSDFTNGNGDTGYSSGKHQFQHQQQQQHHHQQHQQHHHHQQEHHQQPYQQQYHQHHQHKQQYSQHRQEEDAREESVQSPHQSLPVGGSYQFDKTGDFSDLERSASLPPPILGGWQRTLSSESETSFQPNQRYIGDGINREIKQQAKYYKEGVQRGMPVADEVDEEMWPYDPNLVCPHCGKRFRHGQIREFRYHIDDEHPPSVM